MKKRYLYCFKMESTLNERVSQVIKSSGLGSVLSVSKVIGVPQTTLNDCVRGVKNPRVSLLVALIEHFPSISAEWLLTGSGSMYKSEGGGGNVQLGSGNVMAGGDVNVKEGEGGDWQRTMQLEKEVECLRGENERLRGLLEKLIGK